jgi:hypothetical protein
MELERAQLAAQAFHVVTVYENFMAPKCVLTLSNENASREPLPMQVDTFLKWLSSK